MFIEDGDQLSEYLRSIADMVEGLPAERLVVKSSFDAPAVIFAQDFSFTDRCFPIDRNTYWNISIKIRP